MPVVLQYPDGAGTLSLDERLRRPLLTETLLVVPTKRRIRHLSRVVLRSLQRAVAPGFPFHTLETLIRSLYGATDGALPIAGGAVQTLLFQTAVRERGSVLRYFHSRGRDARLFRGTFEKIVEVILGLKESGVYPALLAEELEGAELDEREKLHDMLEIYLGYEDALRRLQMTDLGGVYRALSLECSQEQFIAAFRRGYREVDILSLAGFDEFTEPEIGILRKLCGVPGLNVTLHFDFLPGNPDLFGHLEDNYRRFRDLGFTPVSRASNRGRAGVPAIGGLTPGTEGATADHLARNLFRASPQDGTKDFSSNVTVLRARSRVHEIELVCKLIKRLAKEKPGRDLSAICVAMRHPQLYTDIVREQFPKFGIPVNITDRFDLARSLLVVDLIGVLQVPLRGYRRDDVLRIAQSPYFALGERDAPVNPGNLAASARRLRVTGGVRTWFQVFDAVLGRLAERRKAVRDSEEGARTEREMESLRKARADFAWLSELISPLDREQTASEFRQRLLALCRRLEVQERLLRNDDPEHGMLTEKDVRAFAKFLDVVDETASLLALEEGRDATHPLAFFVERLTLAISRERYNVREQVGEGVLVTSIEETRGLPLDVMILAGMVDGEFPAMYQPEVFLSAHRRRQREQRHHWQNRYLFYQAAANWRDCLVVSYPEKEGELDLVRSPFIDALMKIAAVKELDGGEPGESFLASQEELLRWAARESPGGSEVPEEMRESFREVTRAQAVEKSRLEDHLRPEFEGSIGGSLTDAARASLQQVRERTFSVSQLETYGQCPFKFFAERLLRLRPVEDFEEELTPREKGSLLHEVLFKFYSLRRERGLPPLRGCTDAEFSAALDELTGLARKAFSELNIPDPFWDHERELILGERHPEESLLRQFLDSERGRDDQASPAFFEVGFGRGVGAEAGRDPLLSRDEPVRAGAVSLRGKVDRIDVGKGFFTIIDYKTGREIPRLDDIRKGMSLQLPLYLYAVEMMLDRGSDRVTAAGGLYYQLRDPVRLAAGLANGEYVGAAFAKTRAGQMLKSDAEFRAVIDDAVRTVNEFVDRIAGGEFPLTSPENIKRVCVYCACKTMCRIQTLRHVQSLPGDEP